MDGAAGWVEDHVARRADLDLAGHLLGLVDVHVALEHVTRPAAAARARTKVGGCARKSVVEVPPARLEQPKPTLQLGVRDARAFELGRDVGDPPEVGRAGSGCPLDDGDMGRLAREPCGHAGAPSDVRVAGDVGRERLERCHLRLAPAVEPGPIGRARDDPPAALADLEDHPHRICHASTVAGRPDPGRRGSDRPLGSRPVKGGIDRDGYALEKSAVEGIVAGGVPRMIAISFWSVSSMAFGSPVYASPST